MRKKLLVLCTVFIMCLYLVPTASAQRESAAFKRLEGVFTATDDTEDSMSVNAVDTPVNLDGLMAYMYDKVKSGVTEDIDVSSYGLKKTELSAVMDEFKYRYPLSFLTAYSCEYNDANQIVGKVTVRSFLTTAEAADARVKIDKTVNDFIGTFTEEDTVLDRLLAVHDFLVDQTTYDPNVQGGKPVGDASYSIYGTLINKVSVCQGYAETLSYILTKLDIPHKPCISDSNNHIWNYVRVGERWYHLDATWDDPTNVTIVNHEYFLTDDSTARQQKGFSEGEEDDFRVYSPYDTPPVCNDTRYLSGYLFNGSTSKFVKQNGEYTYRLAFASGDVWNFHSQTLRKMPLILADSDFISEKNGQYRLQLCCNDADTVQNAVLFVACYNDKDILTGYTTVNFSAPQNAGYSRQYIKLYEKDIPVGGYLKVYCWNSSSFAPYSAAPIKIS